MRPRQVGIRKFKATLSQCVREVKGGAVIVLTERGHTVARLIPEAGSLAERLETLAGAGTVLWSGRRLPLRRPSVRQRGEKTVAEIVVEGRG